MDCYYMEGCCVWQELTQQKEQPLDAMRALRRPPVPRARLRGAQPSCLRQKLHTPPPPSFRTLLQKNPRPIKIELALPPPKKPTMPPLKRGILWALGASSRKNQTIQAPIRLAQPFRAPELPVGKMMEMRPPILIEVLFCHTIPCLMT